MAFDYAGKVRALLATADSMEADGNDDAAASYRAKAYQVMRDYDIAQEDAIALDPQAAVPTHLIIEFSFNNWVLASSYPLMARSIARHTGCRVNIESMGAGYRLTFVGYDLDLRYAEFLWTAAHLMFSTRITPTWDDTRSEADNIFLLRNAGIERRVIADKAWGTGDQAAARSKVQRMYLAEAKRRGEEARATGLGFDTKTYRQAYADSFVMTLNRNLRVARDAADSVRGGLVLHGREDRVDAAYDLLFPPPPAGDVVAYVDPTKDCAKCAKAKTTCNDHSYMRPRAWTQRDQLAADRRQYSASAQAGRDSGRAAADGVRVTRGHTTASRLDASGKAIEG